MKYRIPSINHVSFVGRLTKDPEKRKTNKDLSVLSVILATNQRYKAKNSDEWKEKPAFIPFVFWGQLADRIAEKAKKGTPLHVIGKLDSRSYETQQEGQEPLRRQVTEVTGLHAQILSVEETDQAAEEADMPPVGEGQPA